MKKFLINIIVIFTILIIPTNVYAVSTTKANESIDLNKKCSLTLNYYHNDLDFDNTNVKIYYIASVTSDFRYQLSSDFKKYEIKINGITSEKDWNAVKQTLNAYIEADNIKETISQSIQDNTLNITNLTPGLYFIKTEKIDKENYTLIFDSTLISIPDLQEDGSWNYDVLVYPKKEEYTPKYEKITYTAIKTWESDQETRPQSIEIEIYKDSILIDNQTLSNENNWTYKWTTNDDGSTWTVVERNIPEGYNVSILKENLNFTIINTDPSYQENNPITSDNIKLFFYLLFASVIGLLISIIGLKIKNK